MKSFAGFISAVALVSSIASADETILLEENGFLVFEAETIPAVEDWQQGNQIGGFTGTGYYQWTGPTLLSVAQAGRGTLRYHFRISNPGNYELRWRSRIAQGNNGTEHNDSWVRFATGANVSSQQPLNGWTKVFMNKLNEWAWQAATVDNVGRPVRQFFGAGDHTMEISGRSSGHAIDRIVLYRYDDHAFTEDAFTTAAASASTQGPVTLIEPVEAAPETSTPTAEQGATTIEPQIQSSNSTPTVGSANNELPLIGSCTNGLAVVGPSAGLYTQSGSVVSNRELRIEHANRTTFLRFDTHLIPDNFQTVSLQFVIGSDSGNGTLDVYAANHSDWSDSTVDVASLPSATVLVGSKNSQWASGESHEVQLDSASLSNGKLSFLLEAQSSSADFSLSSTASGDNAPRLIFQGSGSDFCSRFIDNQTSTGNEPVALAALESTGTSGNPGGNGGGSIALWLGWLLLLPRAVRSRQPN